MLTIQFSDRMVSYDAFMNDLAGRVAERLAAISSEPEVISQRQAFHQYGRGNVERWTRMEKVHPCKRPGKIEYFTRELREAQQTQQDYFNV